MQLYILTVLPLLLLLLHSLFVLSHVYCLFVHVRVRKRIIFIFLSLCIYHLATAVDNSRPLVSSSTSSRLKYVLLTHATGKMV